MKDLVMSMATTVIFLPTLLFYSMIKYMSLSVLYILTKLMQEEKVEGAYNKQLSMVCKTLLKNNDENLEIQKLHAAHHQEMILKQANRAVHFKEQMMMHIIWKLETIPDHVLYKIVFQLELESRTF